MALRLRRPGLAEQEGDTRPVPIARVGEHPRGAVLGDPQGFEQGQPRVDFVAAGDPAGHVGQQEAAAAHRPADPPGDARQGQHQDRQDVAPDVDPQVVTLAAQRPPEPPDRRAERLAAGIALEPVAVGEVDAVDVRVGLEDLAVARRGQHVDRRAGIRGPQPREQGAGQDGVAQVVELHDQDAPGARPGAPAWRIARRTSPPRPPRRSRGRPLASATCCSGSGRTGTGLGVLAGDLVIDLRRFRATSDQRILTSDVRAEAGVGPLVPSPRDRSADLGGPVGAGVLDPIPEVFAGAAEGRHDHGRPRQGRLQGGQARRLEPARQREDPRRRVGRGERTGRRARAPAGNRANPSPAARQAAS